MEKDKISLISKDLEFVKDTVQDTNKRINGLENSMSSFQKDFAERSANDRQLANEMTRMGSTLEKNTESLIEHMRRTEMNELNINELKNISEKIDSRLKPIEHDIAGRKAVVGLAMKIGGLIGGLVGLLSFLYDIFKR